MIAAQLFPDDALLEEVATAAHKAGMYLIGNGQRIVASPVIPAGWIKIGVKVINRNQARLEAQPCNA